MSLYQTSVLNKYLATQDTVQVEAAFEKYSAYFLDQEIQENIRNSKEEQFQEGFLRELFVNVLGYTINPNPNFNLTTELKNSKNAKKTDGAILKDGSAVAVIELKGTDTKDLDKVNDQAFNYKNNQPDCVYVITSNFEKLRFFIHHAVEHEEFNLFTLTEERFALLWLFLHKDNLLGGIPAKVKEESLFEEEKVTKRLYADYSAFKQELWHDMVRQNPQHAPLLLYQKSQKLLDRFLFIFFAEDKGLLPPNSISVIVEQWTKLKELDEYKPLYDRFKKYFGYMNDGYQGAKYEIPAYNGGLFKADALLDNLLIDDELLQKHCLKLTGYDFADEVDTNILGHIFEHSLNDIENVRAQLAGEAVDKSKTRRKKDGVFYTPKYITKYIVDNTVGTLCEEKKTEIGMDETEFARQQKGRRKETIKKLHGQLKQYRTWLLQLTICDPACGSGAFLNQALEFLMAEHHYVDELEAQLFESGIVFQDVENHILENNLYGVDINEESVEIARLSLWLRTAKKGRKLTSLSSNIKVGNSLIDDPEVAGNLAFNWQEQFPNVFENGGFDVVIGNPPYVKRQNISDESVIRKLERNYSSATYNFDLYLLFIERGSELINNDGILSYINPSKFTSTKTGTGLRKFLASYCHIREFVDFKEYQVFEDATTYCCILFLTNGKKGETIYRVLNKTTPTEIASFVKSTIVIEDSASGLGWSLAPIIKLKSQLRLKKYVNTITGIESGSDSIYILPKDNSEVENWNQSYYEIVFPIIKGTNVSRYYYEDKAYHGIVPYSTDGALIEQEALENNHPNVWNYLLANQADLRLREKGKMNHDKWYGYVYPKNLHKYSNDRIIWPDISVEPQFAIDTSRSWHVRTVCSLELNKSGISQGLTLKSLLPILNSSLLYYFIRTNSNTVQGGYFRYKPQYVKEFPLPINWSVNSMRQMESLADQEIRLHCNRQELSETFLQLISAKFPIEKPSKKLQHWPALDFKGFLAELHKAKVPTLGLEQEAEWMAYFHKKKEEVNSLQAGINRLDQEIDQLVYALYGLTQEEIKIVENG